MGVYGARSDRDAAKRAIPLSRQVKHALGLIEFNSLADFLFVKRVDISALVKLFDD
jgi:hypothetical protein